MIVCEAHPELPVLSPLPSHMQTVGRKNGHCYSYTQNRCLLPLQALHTQMLTAVQEISHLIEPLASAARAEASQLGHKVCKESCEESKGIG